MMFVTAITAKWKEMSLLRLMDLLRLHRRVILVTSSSLKAESGYPTTRHLPNFEGAFGAFIRGSLSNRMILRIKAEKSTVWT